jgi:hypothetical protein
VRPRTGIPAALPALTAAGVAVGPAAAIRGVGVVSGSIVAAPGASDGEDLPACESSGRVRVGRPGASVFDGEQAVINAVAAAPRPSRTMDRLDRRFMLDTRIPGCLAVADVPCSIARSARFAPTCRARPR